jgi:hypothetical protein
VDQMWTTDLEPPPPRTLPHELNVDCGLAEIAPGNVNPRLRFEDPQSHQMWPIAVTSTVHARAWGAPTCYPTRNE